MQHIRTTNLDNAVLPNGAFFSATIGDLGTRQLQTKVNKELQKSASCIGNLSSIILKFNVITRLFLGVFPPINIVAKALNESTALVSWKGRGSMNDYKVFVSSIPTFNQVTYLVDVNYYVITFISLKTHCCMWHVPCCSI